MINRLSTFYQRFLDMASYFEERNVEENEETNARIQRLTREAFRMIFDQDPYRYGDIVHSQVTPPASKTEIDKLNPASEDKLSGNIFIYSYCYSKR